MAFSGAATNDVDDLTRVVATVPIAAADALRVALGEVVERGWGEEDDGDVVRATVWVPTVDVRAIAEITALMRACDPAATVVCEPESTDWQNGLRAHHHPVDIADRIRVRPPWEAARHGLIDIEIDPGMAFGTGQHATTRGCLELLLDVPIGSVLDVGCGSGILAIAARKLGHDPVWAVDVDTLAVDATIANAKVNGVALIVGRRATGQDTLPATQTVMANITERYVAPLVAQLPQPRPSHAILSGFRPHDVAIAVGPWLATGYRLRRQIDADDWTAVALERP